MCDTIAIVRKDRVYFAKNSDRDANEAQILEWHPRRQYPAGSRVKCTHTEIPQVEETNAVLLSRPFWMWGAEMGANEYHVVIGNEAVFTKKPYASTGLTGMDMLRIALERANTAEAACDVIVQLLHDFGQGGGCGLEKPNFTYHNSFIVADPVSAFVVETAGNEHAIEKVQGVRSISNGLTIPGFASKHSDWLNTKVSQSGRRQNRTGSLASKTRGPLHLFATLRDHGTRYTNPTYSIINGGMQNACMHAGGIIVSKQTTGSWVSELHKDGTLHWVTGTAAPCTSLFKPVWVDQPVDLGPAPTDKADDSLWWRHERLHRIVMRNPEVYRDLFVPERNALEAAWIESPPASSEAFAQADELLDKWTKAVAGHSAADVRPGWVKRFWTKRGQMAGLPN